MSKKMFFQKSISSVLALIVLLNVLSNISYTVKAENSVEENGVDWYYTPETLLDFETAYTYSSGEEYYSSTSANWVNGNKRSSHSELVTEADGNTAVRLTYDGTATENYKNNPVLNIFDTNSGDKFIGTAGTTYKISFDYKTESADDTGVQLFVAPSNRCLASAYGYPAFYDTDAGPKAVIVNKTTEFISATEKITESDSNYKTATVEYTALEPVNGYDVYPILIMQTNDKSNTTYTGDYEFASVLIDNIRVEKLNGGLDFEELNFDDNYSEVETFYSSSVNKTSDSARGSHAEITTEADGNKAILLTYDSQNNNYKDNTAFNIYNHATNEKFVGVSGEKYIISFRYKITCTDDKEMQFYIVTTGRDYLYGSDLNANSTAMQSGNWKFTPATQVLTETTDDYITATASFTANGTDYPIILLSTNNSTKDTSRDSTQPYASVLVDDINVEVNQQAYIQARFYNGNEDESILIYKDTTFADLEVPTFKGYIFDGFYLDPDFTSKAADDALVGNYSTIYVKWAGNGSAVTPTKISDYMSVDTIKVFNDCDISGDYSDAKISYTQVSNIDAAGGNTKSNFYGAYTFSSEETVENCGEKIIIDNIAVKNPQENTFIFYVELPYGNADKNWSLGVGDRGLCIYQNSNWIWSDYSDGNSVYSYCLDGEWKVANLTSTGEFADLPVGYKGYIKINLSDFGFGSVDFSTDYTFYCIEFKMNGLGGENGDLILGGLMYFPNDNSDSTVMKIGNLYYDLSVSSKAITASSHSVYSENAEFSVCYSGTEGSPSVEYVNADTSSAAFGKSPVEITTVSGVSETTQGYMTTYINDSTDIVMQPSVDTFMLYVEMPVYNANNTLCGLKLLDLNLVQGSVSTVLNFSNSLYEYLDISSGSWKIARAGADGELNAITSGFKGYIKFNIKQFKNILDITNIDFSALYKITKIEIGFNHIGGENGNLIFGGLYGVIENSHTYFIQDSISGERLCAVVLEGDMDGDGYYKATDITMLRKSIINSDFEEVSMLRKDVNNDGGFDLKDIVRLKKYISEISSPDNRDKSNGVYYKNIFSDDIGSLENATVYPIAAVENYSKIIEADSSRYFDEKATAFAEEINNNKIGDFEKTGIDKMCHVSTFVYAKGNIYMAYYANTISAAESPMYQVARLAYAPENDTSKKKIIDIMQVGDDLYGFKVTGVYDTILMQKDDEPDNLYVLWTASINGKYYRLYSIFNTVTEEMGPVCVNKFKVNDTVNDFSSSGMQKALANEGIGYKTFFSDIGVMQKLSSRIENGEKYYYSGTYSGNFTAIIKSKDLITWEYVAQPNEGANNTGFANATKWENAVYVLGDKVYYYVRQHLPSSNATYGSYYGILTAYNLISGEWETPILVEDCQSRSDFIYYNGNLYLFYAPTPGDGESERCHIGILKIDTEDLINTQVVLQANMNGSCFYPFVQYNSDGELCMSYTVSRQHIRLASFTLSKYLN